MVNSTSKEILVTSDYRNLICKTGKTCFTYSGTSYFLIFNNLHCSSCLKFIYPFSCFLLTFPSLNINYHSHKHKGLYKHT